MVESFKTEPDEENVEEVYEIIESSSLTLQEKEVLFNMASIMNEVDKDKSLEIIKNIVDVLDGGIENQSSFIEALKEINYSSLTKEDKFLLFNVAEQLILENPANERVDMGNYVALERIDTILKKVLDVVERESDANKRSGILEQMTLLISKVEPGEELYPRNIGIRLYTNIINSSVFDGDIDATGQIIRKSQPSLLISNLSALRELYIDSMKNGFAGLNFFKLSIKSLESLDELNSSTALSLAYAISTEEELNRVKEILNSCENFSIGMFLLYGYYVNNRDDFNKDIIMRMTSLIQENLSDIKGDGIFYLWNSLLADKSFNPATLLTDQEKRRNLVELLKSIKREQVPFLKSFLFSSENFSLALALKVVKEMDALRNHEYWEDIKWCMAYLINKKGLNLADFDVEMQRIIKTVAEKRERGEIINHKEVVFGHKGTSDYRNFKAEMMNELYSYYDSFYDSDERSEIMERLNYLKDALNEIYNTTSFAFTSKVSFNANGEFTPEEIKEIKLYAAIGVYYAYWLRYGSDAKRIFYNDKDLKIVITRGNNFSSYEGNTHTIYLNLDSINGDNILEKNRSSPVAFYKRVFNTALHEGLHSIGSKVKGQAFGEFATALAQHFYLPAKNSEIGTKMALGSRIPEVIKRNMAPGNINAEMYLLREYPDYYLMQYFNFAMGRNKTLEAFRKGELDDFLIVPTMVTTLSSLTSEEIKSIKRLSLFLYVFNLAGTDKNRARNLLNRPEFGNIDMELKADVLNFYENGLSDISVSEEGGRFISSIEVLKRVMDVYQQYTLTSSTGSEATIVSSLANRFYLAYKSYREVLRKYNILNEEQINELDSQFILDFISLHRASDYLISNSIKVMFDSTLKKLDEFLGEKVKESPLKLYSVNYENEMFYNTGIRYA